MTQQKYINKTLRGRGASWDSQFNPALSMTRGSINSTKVKNKQENHRLATNLRQIGKFQEKSLILTNRNLTNAKEEYTRILASGQV